MQVSQIVSDYFTKFRDSAPGGILEPDGMFLLQTLLDRGVSSCFELGVASGFSSGLMLTAMEIFNPEFQLYLRRSNETDWLHHPGNQPESKMSFRITFGSLVWNDAPGFGRQKDRCDFHRRLPSPSMAAD